MDLDRELAALNGWSGNTEAIHKEYRFSDFKAAMAFMQAAVDDIESLGHHPEWRNVYNTVSITLRTHDAGDIVTEKDIALAKVLDRIAG
ncbi:MAG: 4a-hydroxytetrahydrobiopterin dehydratase [Planctomycetota bacterium]|nr:MAG: 4a-hydroxytetrahydrobiopterin dehydratase [Planctomycetota bacterium]